ncbi:putative secreted protein (Por secretion system target) [Dyadobacter jejuensis]|uniref:Putative secreted protein (Por secretion system target) n=1 Tax=Dyadobacter jejuensis TaxID=1082580 RepID=A0A316A779_9BACT|nr:fibronectin type III domain-containing protein [Dyadobacter jejuensis]PWJ53575.1 putative secreted protein (Por secretion system target) [Dyadobacter jejuensis]
MKNITTAVDDFPVVIKLIKFLVVIQFICLVSSPLTAQVLVGFQSNWKYAPESNTAPAAGWPGLSYDDSSWKTGNGAFGFGTHAYQTLLIRYPAPPAPANNIPVYYFRKAVTIPDVSAYASFRLRAFLDDGIVIYINGVEVSRKNMNPNPSDPYTRSAGDSLNIDSLLSTSLFQNGVNIIAAEVHQTGETSSDILFDLQLEGNAVSTASASIPYKSTWKYLDNGTDQGTAWRSSGFNDASWSSGPGSFGFGGYHPGTVLASGPDQGHYSIYYFRKHLSVSDPSSFSSFHLRAYYDDGMVVYVNGVEVLRRNAPAGIGYTITAGDSITVDTLLSSSLFLAGDNIIAVELRQRNAGSSDVLMDLQLQGNPIAMTDLLLPYQSTWKYLDNGSDQGTTWRNLGFNDASWSSGLGSFGFGGYSPNTILASGPNQGHYSIYYFRKHVSVSDPSAFNGVRLQAYYDDGMVVYINGVEALRRNAPAGIGYTIIAGDSVAVDTVLSTSLFVAGDNIVAVELRQRNAGSSDVLMDLQLEGLTGSITLDRYPYLQLASYDRMTVMWYTHQPANSTVRYSLSPDLSSGYTEVSVASVDTIHRVNLRNLLADTKYYYNVGYGTGVDFQLLQYDPTLNYFRTLPTPADTSHSIRLWLLGDSGGGKRLNPRPKKVRNAYMNYLASINNPHVDGLLFLGDNSNTSPYEGFQPALDSTIFLYYNQPTDRQLLSFIPSWTVFGNHDYNPDFPYLHTDGMSYKIRKAYHNQTAASFTTFAFPDSAQIGGEPTYNQYGYYSFDQGDVHIVVLNPYLIEYDIPTDNWLEASFDNHYNIFSKNSIAQDNTFDTPIDSLPQVKWLIRDLMNNTKKWTLATFHLPPFTTIGHFPDEFDIKRVSERLLPILEKPEYRLDALLVSHSHAYLRAGMIRKVANQARTTDYNETKSPGQENGNLGRYPSTAPYIKTNNETAYTYIMSGSAGRGFNGTVNGIPVNDAGFNDNDANLVKHPRTSVPPLDNLTGDNTTAFYHVTGGSVELLFRENRLDVKFIKELDAAPNFFVADSFVVMKDVNINKVIDLESGDSVRLGASWIGEYNWYSTPSGGSGSRTSSTNELIATGVRYITVMPDDTTTYFVQDGPNYLADTFMVNVINAFPVYLVKFSAQQSEKTIVLNWATTAETNSERFEIQRSLDGKHWVAIGEVSAKGESAVYQSYLYIDTHPYIGINFYRLKMIDHDQSYALSRIVDVRFDLPFETMVYPNPSDDYLEVWVSDWKQIRTVSILNSKGQVLYESGPITNGSVDIHSLVPGIYLVNFTRVDGQVYTHKMLRK